LIEAVSHSLTPFYLLGYYICSGKDPTEANKNLPEFKGVLEIVAAVLHIIIYLKIYIYKHKGQSILPQRVYCLKTFGLKDIEKSLLANYNITQFVCILIMIGSAVIVKPLEGETQRTTDNIP